MEQEFSKAPSFNDTNLNSPVNEFALGLCALKDDIYYGSGTAVVIGRYLAITAKHVIEDFVSHFDSVKLPEEGTVDHDASFNLQAFRILENGSSGKLYDITKIWYCKFSDLALVRLSPRTGDDSVWRLPKLDLRVPAVGSRLSSFGHRNPSIERSGGNISWTVDSKTSVGEVREIHDERRDSSRMQFPCFQTNARFDGSMSGGPVFTDEGNLCGLICSNMPPFSEDEEHISYVVSLWPLMGLELDMPRAGHPADSKYTVYELARDGFINTVGWEDIEVHRNDLGVVTQVKMKKSN